MTEKWKKIFKHCEEMKGQVESKMSSILENKIREVAGRI